MNAEWGMRNGEWGVGSRDKEMVFPSPFPTAHCPLPIPHSSIFMVDFRKRGYQ
jgi:hypothetical protein